MSNVSALKNRFEKLGNNLQSLDVSSIKLTKSDPPIKFYRSVTCMDFTKIKQKVYENAPVEPEQRSSNSFTNTSIKRSPAFRLDSHIKPQIIKNGVVERKLSDNNEIVNELEYLKASDTIKKALKKPLPCGAPPPKPPRAFQSPLKETIAKLESQSIQQEVHRPVEIKTNPNTLPRKTETKKTQDKKAISSFLNCISPCHQIDPIYYEQIKMREANETIYMEPFVHLKTNASKSESIVNPNPGELHYMCTVLDPQPSYDVTKNYHEHVTMNQSNSDSKNIDNYEKMNLLLNVAFDENHRDNILDETSHSSTESKNSKPKIVLRSLTEKRKNYVRRRTQSIKLKDKTKVYGSLKTLPSAASRIAKFQNIIDSRKSCESTMKADTSEKLFDMIILIGFDVINMKTYIKTTYPKNISMPSMIEHFIYPTQRMSSDLMTKENQNFSLILTDENGGHCYGYCRQVVPEGLEICLPLTYCIISHAKATGFYFSVLNEIESRHGQTEQQLNYLLRNLINQPIPERGSSLSVLLMAPTSSKKLPEIAKKLDLELMQKSQSRFTKRLSIETPAWLTENSTSSSKETESSKISDSILIRRSKDLRFDEDELSVLYDCTTNDLLVNIFGTLLIERKVVLISNNISKLSSCVMALHSILYPFKWQHTIISITPDDLSEIVQMPFPSVIGILKNSVKLCDLMEIEDGIVVDLETKTLLKSCGDELTLVPETLRKSLILSLKIVDAVHQEKALSNVLIHEAFLQYFVKIFSKLDTKTFQKDKYIESQSNESVRFFLEWFLETVMFKEFLHEKVKHDEHRQSGVAPISTYFELFDAKVIEKSATLSSHEQKRNVELFMKKSRQANRKRNFKERIKDFLNSN